MSVAAEVVPATVGVELGGVRASGVVVSAEGDVLTASHVAGEPGREVTIVFPDGRRLAAETLGLNPDVDGALVRITETGTWPFTPIVPEGELPQPGDWCVGTGHPGSYQPDRSPPVRLGRVIEANRYVLRTDCLITPGDSGGPLFDLQGRVIGIHSRISESPTMNLHAPAISYLQTWQSLRSGHVSRVSPRSLFLAQFDFNQDGILSHAEIPEGTYREVFSRLTGRYGLDEDRSYSIEELRETLGLKIAPDRIDDGRRGFAADHFLGGAVSRAEILHSESFTRGAAVLAAFEGAIRDVRRSTVAVYSQAGERLALGTVVAADGLVVTKHSQVTQDAESRRQFQCELFDGRKVPARMLAHGERDDLALLKLEAADLTPVDLSPAPDLEVAQWVITPGIGRQPVSVGILSVTPRPILGAPGFLGVEGAVGEAGPVIEGIIHGTGAFGSKLLIGDTITHVGERRVATFTELGAAVRHHRPGEHVPLTVLRDGQEQVVDVRLGRHPSYRPTPPDSMSGPISVRREDFSVALQHDSVMDPTECGGPLVDLSGRVIGINIARAERTTSYALAVEAIIRQLDELRRTEASQRQHP